MFDMKRAAIEMAQRNAPRRRGNVIWSVPVVIEKKTDRRGNEREIKRSYPSPHGAVYPYASKRQIERRAK